MKKLLSLALAAAMALSIAACSVQNPSNSNNNVGGSNPSTPAGSQTPGTPAGSNGGSAMMSAWGLLAFLKAADTRENASFAIRRRKFRSAPPG